MQLPITLPRQHRIEMFAARMEPLMAGLAMLVAPVLVAEGHAQSAVVRDAARLLNWAIWLAFCGRYALKTAVAPKGGMRGGLDLLIVLLTVPLSLSGLSGGTPTRFVDLLRFLRGAVVAALGLQMRRETLRPNRLHFAAVTTVVIVGLGALGIFAVESGTNGRIHTFGDALWWSVVTATTVGYGDVSPVTPEGRFIAVGLMLLGIGFIGVFTAAVSSYFFDQGRVSQVEERLARIEAKLDAIRSSRRV
jgi:voltage-gated potassium channel